MIVRWDSEATLDAQAGDRSAVVGPAPVRTAACAAILLLALAAGCRAEAATPGPDGPPPAAGRAAGHAADTAVFAADLDGDGDHETITVRTGAAGIVIEDGSQTYRSHPRWRVLQAHVGDADGDGTPEVVALLEDDEGRHLGLFAWRGDRYRERLVTQELAPPPASFHLSGQHTGPDLVVVHEEPDGVVTYRWNGFGFTALDPTR